MNPSIVNNVVPKTTLIFGATHSIFFGAGLSYAIETENYLHIPLIFFYPVSYGSYQLFKNKNSINPF